MAITGSYRINFTDPKKGSFIIEPYTVNGTVTATSSTLHPRATRADTPLLLYGQYVPNYGERIHENLLHLLENFCGDIPPTNAVEGQLWYDTGDSFRIISLADGGLGVVSGNQSESFSQYVANGTALTIWYDPQPIDNTYQELRVIAQSYAVGADGNTTVLFADADTTTQIQLPSTAVDGFITPTSSSSTSRLRVATLVNDEIVWTDVVGVQCSPTAPVPSVSSTGDLWFNTTTETLYVRVGAGWVDVAGNALQLSGGTMAGPIEMGIHPITYTGPVIESDVLTPKSYVDSAIASAVNDSSSGLGAVVDDLSDRMNVVELTLPEKLNRLGGNIRTTLVFGDDSTTTTLSAGIDMKNQPIINPQITWNAADYLMTATEPNHVVDKEYVGRAFSQHLSDVVHNEKGYLIEQVSGEGLIPGNIYFDGEYSLRWNRNGTTYAAFVENNALVLTSGSNSADRLELRHGSQPPIVTDPAFAVEEIANVSYRTIYILDGQPQPVDLGGILDRNDDTAAATKGFVREHVSAAVVGFSPVIDASYDTATFTLSLTRNNDTPIVLDLTHTHPATPVTYTYVDMVNWVGGTTDLVKEHLVAASVPLDAVPVDTMLTELNLTKAPVQGATFVDLPTTTKTASVISVNNSVNGIELDRSLPTLLPGYPVTIKDTGGTLTTYTFLGFEIVAVPDIDDPLIIDDVEYAMIKETLPAFVVGTDSWQLTYGEVAPQTSGGAYVTRTALDFETSKLQPKEGVDELLAAGPLTAALNGQFIKCDSATAMDVTVPAGLPDGFTAKLIQVGTGQVTVVGSGGVTVVSAVGTKTRAQYSVITVKQLTPTQYVVYDDATT